MAAQTLEEKNVSSQDTSALDTPASSQAKAPVQWRFMLIAGLITGLLWALVLTLGGQSLLLIVGVVPVVSGMVVGRRIKGRAFANSLVMALSGALAAAIVVCAYYYLIVTPEQLVTLQNPDAAPSSPENIRTALVLSSLLMMLISLVPFTIYGVWISHRTYLRNQDYKQEVDRRGGTLQRAGRVAAIEDLQGLPLPKFASWVSQLFKQNGFVLQDYRFQKDSIELHMRRLDPEELWLVRCTTEEVLKPGMAQSLDQDLRASDEFTKGIVLTSMKVQDGTRKWAKGRRNIEVLDGETLWEMHEAA